MDYIASVKAPATLPDGYGMLILERCSHSSGDAYDLRFFAVKRGTHLLEARYESDGSPLDLPGRQYAVGDTPTVYSFMDRNDDYAFLLPEGSMEFVDGGWVPCEAAQYHY